MSGLTVLCPAYHSIFFRTLATIDTKDFVFSLVYLKLDVSFVCVGCWFNEARVGPIS